MKTGELSYYLGIIDNSFFVSNILNYKEINTKVTRGECACFIKMA